MKPDKPPRVIFINVKFASVLCTLKVVFKISKVAILNPTYGKMLSREDPRPAYIPMKPLF
jgi:hypothetical protein